MKFISTRKLKAKNSQENSTKLIAKKLGHLDGKTAKNGYLYVPFSQKLLFKIKKSLTKRSARSKNFSCLAKICSPRQLFSLSLLGQNAA